MRLRHDSRGDTIVEVLLALTVLTTVVVGAYVTTNRAQNTTQASQERAEGTKVAESQLERLKSLLAAETPAPLPSGDFCILDTNMTASTSRSTMPFPDGCGDRGGRYNVAIEKQANNTYEIFVKWFRVGGGEDQMKMYYRAH